jgi:hypothetical protein
MLLQLMFFLHHTAAVTALCCICRFYLTSLMLLLLLLLLLQDHREQLPQLPAGILQQVLSDLPLRLRLGSCSLASRAMHAAAIAATDDIDLEDLNNQQKALDLSRWLARYGSQALRHLSLAGCMLQQDVLSVALPSGLQQLQSLALSNVALPAALDSCAHPKLTSLLLQFCAVRPCCDMFAWVARQLVHLTGLQCLELHWLDEHDAEPSAAGVRALEEALGQLQQLTCLGFTSSRAIAAAMAGASSLSQLQELRLEYLETAEPPLQMQWLPSSLTYIALANCTMSGAAGSSSSCSSSDWKLPVLEQLELNRVSGFKPALLKQMPQLRMFSFRALEALEVVYEEPPPTFEQQLVEVLPQLPQLQHLRLQYSSHWPSPSRCASLTASSQLTALILLDCSLPAGAVQHMFAAGQRLQQLQWIDVMAPQAASLEGNQAEVNHQFDPDLQITLDYNASLLQPDSLNLGPGDLAQLASCCPRLHGLQTIWCDLPGPARGEAAGEAAPLLQLTALTALEVAGQYWNDAVVESVLAKMTGEVNTAASLDSTSTCCSRKLLSDSFVWLHCK